MKPWPLIIIFLCRFVSAEAQTLGGSTVYNFLRLPNTPQLTALGGINISNQSDDVGMSFQNPSLLRESMHTQANFVFNSMYGDINIYQLQLGFHSKPIQTNFSFGVHYFNYGSITETDASGNVLGAFRPSDYVVQVGMSRRYLARWYYGANLKFVNSNYASFRSSGLAGDLGLSYLDTAAGLQASLALKNMGAQIRFYNGAGAEELPFDIQLGVSKRLKNAPLQFSVTANRLHRFDLTYNDTVFNNENGFSNSGKAFSFDNIFRHFVFATQVYIGERVELTLGYNYLRRKELNIGNSGNGLNGFSAGVGVIFKKIQLRYGRAYYQGSRSYHQLGLSLKLNEYFGLGKFGQRAGW